MTTIQVDEKTLFLLKKLKEEMNAGSYGEAIVKVVAGRPMKSMAGSLKKYFKNSTGRYSKRNAT